MQISTNSGWNSSDLVPCGTREEGNHNSIFDASKTSFCSILGCRDSFKWSREGFKFYLDKTGRKKKKTSVCYPQITEWSPHQRACHFRNWNHDQQHVRCLLFCAKLDTSEKPSFQCICVCKSQCSLAAVGSVHFKEAAEGLLCPS